MDSFGGAAFYLEVSLVVMVMVLLARRKGE